MNAINKNILVNAINKNILVQCKHCGSFHENTDHGRAEHLALKQRRCMNEEDVALLMSGLIEQYEFANAALMSCGHDGIKATSIVCIYFLFQF